MQFPELTSSSMSLNAVSGACLQFLSLYEQLTRILQCLLSFSREQKDSGTYSGHLAVNGMEGKSGDSARSSYSFDATWGKASEMKKET